MAESHLEFTKPAHVVGRYALYGRLAAGGMATVHLGRMMELDGTSRTVAVKRLHPQFCKDPEFVAMFIDEARLAARIKHPNVVETLDILTMGQELLLVMEYIRGECFSKLLRAARRKNLEPSIRVVGHIASGMLHGLHAAHEAKDDRGEPLNVVHRDISPQNVMIDVDGGVKVLDFGVAKASARIQITRDGQMKGKLSYMSPEQLQGMPVDRRADVFACGVVLWEALTRRRLFVGEDASEVLRKILRDEVPRPSEFVPELTPAMDQVVLRALCKDPERRYQTAEELALDIENVIGLADPSDVTAWIYSVAGEVLTKRERLLEEIERLGAEGFPLPAADATGGSVHGSITDSDTFQRIQSWAEREAARAADLPSHPSLGLDDDAAATVADTRVESGPLRSSQPGALQPGALQPGLPALPVTPLPPAARLPAPLPPALHWAAQPAAPTSSDFAALSAKSPALGGAGELAGEEEETLLDADVEEEPTSRVSVPEAVAAQSPGTVAVFSHAPRPESEGAVRRRRRMLALLSAAGIFGVLTLVAVVAMQPVQLTSTSGALRPEASGASRPEATAALRPELRSDAPAAARSAATAALRADPAQARPEASSALAANKASAAAAQSAAVVPAAVKESSAPLLEREAPARAPGERAGAALAGGRSEPPIARAVAPAAEPRSFEAPGVSPPPQEASGDGLDEAAAKGVSLALSQTGKDRQSGAAKQRVPKRAPAAAPPPRRTRATTPAPRSAPAATPASAAANKLDCKQPFWIDEKGIRRLKMACL